MSYIDGEISHDANVALGAVLSQLLPLPEEHILRKFMGLYFF